MIKLKKTTVKDIVEYGTNCKVIDLSTKYNEELGNTVIYIRATIQVSEVIGKTTITEKQTANLIYIADTHALLNSEWEQIA